MLAHQVLQDAGVQITGAGAHGNAGQGGEAHGGVHALAAIHGGHGGAVAQVAGDDFQLLNGLAQHGGSAGGDIAVGGAVEAVAADLVLLIELIGQGVDIALGGHGLVESGVEHTHHGHTGHDLLAGLDAGDVGGIVEGGQGDALFQSGHNLVGNAHGGGELLAAVDHAVAHRVDLRGTLDHAVPGVQQGVQHSLNGLGVSGHGDLELILGVLGGHLVSQAAVDADALAQPLGEHLTGGGVHELILEGGAACVDDQNFHEIFSPYVKLWLVSRIFP